MDNIVDIPEGWYVVPPSFVEESKELLEMAFSQQTWASLQLVDLESKKPFAKVCFLKEV